jgi:ATP-dependent RNA helicase SUPV3L1/SUV3
VATDAIGLGLNLDLERVAFASTSKFDGFEQRDLRPDELAQIAGRAGRHMNDGSFGTLNSTPELGPRTIEAIEAHRFPPARSLVWRSNALDYASPEGLLDSLAQAPVRSVFARVERADDFDTLKALAADPEVRQIATDRASVGLLWEVCQVPDFRKRLFGQHVAVLREIFLQLAGGRLRPEWLTTQLAPLGEVTGDLYALTDRLATIRIWTYVSQRSAWLGEAEVWQQRTRAMEDALSDALHQRLVERFVERSARRTPRRFHQRPAAALDGPFAKLGLLSGGVPGPEAATEEQFVHQVVDAAHEAFEVDASGRISLEGEPLARLVRGADRRSPQVALLEPEAWTGGARRRLERRLVAFARDLVAEAMGGFPAALLTHPTCAPATRGLAYRLAEGLGVVRRREALEQAQLLDEASRVRFEELGVREGQHFVGVAAALLMRALERRCLLTALDDGQPAPEGAPREATLPSHDFGDRDPERYGYERFGPVALRIDIVEQLGLAARASGGDVQVLALCAELGLDGAVSASVLRSLGGAPPPKSGRESRHGWRSRRHS